jgi:hypothetical protein
MAPTASALGGGSSPSTAAAAGRAAVVLLGVGEAEEVPIELMLLSATVLGVWGSYSGVVRKRQAVSEVSGSCPLYVSFISTKVVVGVARHPKPVKSAKGSI